MTLSPAHRRTGGECLADEDANPDHHGLLAAAAAGLWDARRAALRAGLSRADIIQAEGQLASLPQVLACAEVNP